MKYFPVVALISLSIFTHFLFFGYPNQIVFDEVYYVHFASSYTLGNYFFDVHPPLAKLLITGMGEIGKMTPDTPLMKIGAVFSSDYYLWYRFLPTFLGALFPLLIYFICRRLRMSKSASFFAGLAIILENSLLVQSRLILPEIFILFFGFTGILFYLMSIQTASKKKFWLFRACSQSNRKIIKEIPLVCPNVQISATNCEIFVKRARYLYSNFAIFATKFRHLFQTLDCEQALKILSVIFLTFAFCVKWTGLSFLGLVAAAEGWQFVSSNKIRIIFGKRGLKWLADKILFFFAIPLLIYFSIFLIHFSILKHSGEGNSFMTPFFQKTLEGNKYAGDQTILPENILEKFIELNSAMFLANQFLIGTHSYSSKWYTWPIMLRPIYYWSSNGKWISSAKIYLIGNPLIYWSSSLSVIFLAVFLIWKKIKKRFDRKALFLFAGYLFNFLPFALITRGMFLYHYFPALVFAVIILAYLLDKIKNKKIKTASFILLGAVFLFFFLYFAPLSYGTNLSMKALDAKFWLKTWK